MRTIKKVSKTYLAYPAKKAGFAMLFSVVVSSIILAIALGVTEIAIKELSFDTSAKSANDAFFAADTATECALYYDLAVGDTSAFGVPPLPDFPEPGFNVSCAGTDLDLNNGNSTPSGSPYFFDLYPLSPSGSACAKVRVDKTTDPDSTTITARGYNLGGNTTDCTSSNQNRVERELFVTIGEGPAIVPPPSYMLNVSTAGPGVVTSNLFGINCGNGNTDCSAEYNNGTDVTLVANPNSGYEVSWTGGGCTVGNSCVVQMNNNINVTVTFSLVTHNVTVLLAGPTDAGVVTSVSVPANPSGISCSPICGADFEEGSDITLTATPNAGYAFTGWAGACTNGSGSCVINNITSDKIVTATFAPLYPQVASEVTTIVPENVTHVISLPSGIQDQDLLLLFISLDANINYNNWPAGWVSLVNTGQGTNKLEVRYKIADGTEGSTLTLSLGVGNEQPAAYQALRITNYFGLPEAASISLNANPPNLNPAGWGTEHTLWFAASSRNHGDQYPTTVYPAGYTNQTTVHAPPSGTDGTTLATARREAFVAAENPEPAFAIGGSTSWQAATIGVRAP